MNGIVFTTWKDEGTGHLDPDPPEGAVIITGQEINDAGGGDTDVVISYRPSVTLSYGPASDR
jgi:hypothetical protein